MSGKDVIRKLQNKGWAVVRIRGSHYVLKKEGKSVPIPVHGNKDLGIGLIAEIEHATGVKL